MKITIKIEIIPLEDIQGCLLRAETVPTEWGVFLDGKYLTGFKTKQGAESLFNNLKKALRCRIETI